MDYFIEKYRSYGDPVKGDLGSPKDKSTTSILSPVEGQRLCKIFQWSSVPGLKGLCIFCE